VLGVTAVAHALEYRLVRTLPVDRGRALAAAGGRVVVTFDGATWLLEAATGEFVQGFSTPVAVGHPPHLVSAALIGDRVLVGAPARDAIGEVGGGVYVFSTIPDIAARTLTRPQPARFDSFGHAMAVAGSNVVVGSPGNLGPGDDERVAGAA